MRGGGGWVHGRESQGCGQMGKGPPREAPSDWVPEASPGQALGARAACKQMASRLRKPTPACRYSLQKLGVKKQQLLNLT